MHFRKLQLCLALSLLLACRAHAPAAAHRESQPRWLDWSAEAFTRARTEHKLILISLQAGFCHWCHVMNATTYRDPRVLKLLTEHFVVLRADEASRPDLRERYAAWGWPATALLTPEGQPITVLRGHQPPAPFAALLEQLVSQQQRGLPFASDAVVAPRAASDLLATLQQARAQLDAAYDPQQGGWGRPQKYPYAAPVEQALLRAAQGELAYAERALHSLHGYRQLIDPVASGMYQYSLEGAWTAPHFEKLLSIQAGALSNFSAGYRSGGDVALLAAARGIASYVLATLRSADGAFYASQAADVGELGAPSYLEGKRYYAGDAQQRTRSASPALDTHVYANLNGMMIEALCELYRADRDPRWLAAAQAASTAVAARLLRGAAYLHEQDAAPVFYLSDQVEMARALLALGRASGDLEQTARANRTLDFVREHLRDAASGGFFSHTLTGDERGVFAQRALPYDENARLSRMLLARAHVEDDEALHEQARQALAALARPDEVRALGRQVGEYALALEQLLGPYVMFSVVGEAHDPRTLALFDAAYRSYVPQGILALSTPERSRYPYPGKPAIYLCSENACSSPVKEVAQLAAALQAFLRPEP